MNQRYSRGVGDERFTIYKGSTTYVIVMKYSLTMTPEELTRFIDSMVTLLNASNEPL